MGTPSLSDVLPFWLGPLDADGLATADRAERWFAKSAELDALVRTTFEAAHEGLLREGEAFVPRDSREALAAIVVLDQFSRNMFRGTPEMFAADPLALTLARRLVDTGAHAELAVHERVFVYLPFMHAENLEDQEACVQLMVALVEGSEGRAREAVAQNVQFARAHRDIVARFGRFPHRNAILGRVSSPEEIAFLAEPGSSF
jgi:uncharacterized protein (DUF924 family)